MKGLRGPALMTICRLMASHGTVATFRTCSDAYRFVASQDETTQRHIFDEARSVLANASIETCTVSWVAKHKKDEEEAEIRSIRRRIDDLNSSVRSYGICITYLRGWY